MFSTKKRGRNKEKLGEEIRPILAKIFTAEKKKFVPQNFLKCQDVGRKQNECKLTSSCCVGCASPMTYSKHGKDVTIICVYCVGFYRVFVVFDNLKNMYNSLVLSI